MTSEVKQGYKQTEIGVIPEDWEVKTVGNIAPLQRGFDLTKFQIKEGSIPVVYSNGIENYHDIAMVQGPGVVTGRSGTLGRVHYVENHFWPHNTSLWVTQFNGNIPKFIYYLYDAIRFDRFSSGSGVPTLNRNDAHDYCVAIPPTKAEQEAIAEVLSDADALIESLEQLIVKKRQIKQAAMQDLLTGKKRLPGFTGQWRVKKLDEIGDIRSGGTPSTSQLHYWDGDIPWCIPTDITALRGKKYIDNTERKISEAGLRTSSAELIPRGSLIMTSRATIGECAINKVPVATNQGFKNIVPYQETDTEFLYYLMTIQKQQLIALCGGSTFLEIGKKQLAVFEVLRPLDKSEQAAIASVLSDMDAEIAALESKLEKARQLKQGMMHNLLTGKIRLV